MKKQKIMDKLEVQNIVSTIIGIYESFKKNSQVLVVQTMQGMKNYIRLPSSTISYYHTNTLSRTGPRRKTHREEEW